MTVNHKMNHNPWAHIGGNSYSVHTTAAVSRTMLPKKFETAISCFGAGLEPSLPARVTAIARDDGTPTQFHIWRRSPQPQAHRPNVPSVVRALKTW